MTEITCVATSLNFFSFSHKPDPNPPSAYAARTMTGKPMVLAAFTADSTYNRKTKWLPWSLILVHTIMINYSLIMTSWLLLHSLTKRNGGKKWLGLIRMNYVQNFGSLAFISKICLPAYCFHSNTWCNLLSNLFELVSKNLSVLCGFDWLYWCSQDLEIQKQQSTLLHTMNQSGDFCFAQKWCTTRMQHLYNHCKFTSSICLIWNLVQTSLHVKPIIQKSVSIYHMPFSCKSNSFSHGRF